MIEGLPKEIRLSKLLIRCKRLGLIRFRNNLTFLMELRKVSKIKGTSQLIIKVNKFQNLISILKKNKKFKIRKKIFQNFSLKMMLNFPNLMILMNLPKTNRVS